eukprot:TRINITY_DN8641_c0_g1_i1.p1 TRINITY_DN8641_c0_g1~~TRINITY_DN8641_c0_g1_i1.p1  ORF type:complete len:529 (-),score=139.97 TRINITY_DN8641_c0_g1_i1:41-1627(-)
MQKALPKRLPSKGYRPMPIANERGIAGVSAIMKSRMGGREDGQLFTPKPELRNLADLLKNEAIPLNATRHTGATFHPEAYDRLLEGMGDASIITLGHSMFGADELHRERINLSKRIIEEKNISNIALEADYFDVMEINKYITGKIDENPLDTRVTSEADAANEEKFPLYAWPVRLWRNTHTLSFVRWLRQYNQDRPEERRVSIHGTDCYRTWFESARYVLQHIQRRDPENFPHFEVDYGFLKYKNLDHYQMGMARGIKSSRSDVAHAFHAMRRNYEKILRDPNASVARVDEEFDALMNALAIKDGEDIAFLMIEEDKLSNTQTMLSWNSRDSHMLNALKHIRSHSEAQFRRARLDRPVKTLYLGHMSHMLDESGAPRSMLGGMNMGEILRNEFGIENTFSVGFIPKSGIISASHQMNGNYENFEIKDPHFQSLEVSLDELEAVQNLYLLFRSNNPEVVVSDKNLKTFSNREMFIRCVGPIYNEVSEETAHFTQCTPGLAMDAVVAIGRVKPITPLDTYVSPQPQPEAQ